MRLQNKAEELFEKIASKKSALIYRTELGGFSFTRPVYVFPNNAAKNPAHKIDNESIKRRREAIKNKEIDKNEPPLKRQRLDND